MHWKFARKSAAVSGFWKYLVSHLVDFIPPKHGGNAKHHTSKTHIHRLIPSLYNKNLAGTAVPPIFDSVYIPLIAQAAGSHSFNKNAYEGHCVIKGSVIYGPLLVAGFRIEPDYLPR
jgi:hypothetical protein